MNIASFDIYRYSLPLTRPLVMRGQSFEQRHGLLLRLRDKDGHGGWGEAAPLPGTSTETTDQALDALLTLRRNVRGSDVPDHLEELSGGFRQWLEKLSLPPSVQCGFEAAVLALIAAGREVSLSRLLSDNPLPTVSVNALISATGDEIKPELDRVLSSGYHTVKVKVGRQSIDDDISMVRQVCSAAGDKLAVRLDANRAWSFDRALTFARAIEPCGIEYLEEPLEKAVAMEAFSCETDLPLALDESLNDFTPETLPLAHGITAIVIRPMLLGGMERSMMFARRAQAQGVRAVISSAVESAVGIGALASFAAAMNATDIAIGLDTLSWFAEQPVTTPYAITDGGLRPDVVFPRSQNVIENSLEEITDG